MRNEAYIFELTKAENKSGSERKTGTHTTYYAQRINDDLWGRAMSGELVTSNTPEGLAKKVLKYIERKGKGENTRREFIFHPNADRMKRRGELPHTCDNDMSHDDEVRFHLGLTD